MRSKSSTTEIGTRASAASAGAPSAGQPPEGSPSQVLVGTILRPHGVKGEVTVQLWSDNDRRFAPGVALAAFPAAARTAAGQPAPGRSERTLRVERSTSHKGGLRVAFAGIADREAAETLRGLDLWVPFSAVPPAPAGSFYYFELIGCRCFDAGSGASVEIGTVVDLLEDGGGTLLEVERDGLRTVIPFVEAFLAGVDRPARRIDLRLPEGLLATCASRS